jgi:hypothetical protein
MIKSSQQDSSILGIKGSLVQGRSQIKRKICQKYNASTVECMVTTKSLSRAKEKKEIHEESVAEEGKPSRKTKQDETNFFF